MSLLLCVMVLWVYSLNGLLISEMPGPISFSSYPSLQYQSNTQKGLSLSDHSNAVVLAPSFLAISCAFVISHRAIPLCRCSSLTYRFHTRASPSCSPFL